jgi:hypothetical protein
MTFRPRVVLASLALLLELSCGGLWLAQRASERAATRADVATARRVELPRATRPALILPAASVPLAAPSAPTPPGMSENELMTELRAFKDSDLRLSIERAREGNRRFPNSADAPERGSILIHALARAGRSAEARGEAEDMVNRYPDSEWVREVERFTGAHRHRNVHLNDDGQLAFE